jgi:hypothetical protein
LPERGLRLLNGVDELVGYEPESIASMGSVLAAAEDDVGPNRIGECVHCCGRALRLFVNMDPDTAEVMLEAGFQNAPYNRVQRVAR